MEDQALRVLVVEDSALDGELVLATLASQGVAATSERVETAQELEAALEDGRPDGTCGVLGQADRDRAAGCDGALNSQPQKWKTPVGSGRFPVVNLGVVGVF